jgi:hypothetical protein
VPGLPPGPAYSHIPEGDWTTGDVVSGLCHDAGYSPDLDQRVCLDGIFARVASTGKSAASSVSLIAPRRNLKTGTITMAVLGWLFIEHCPEIVWTAHEWAAVDEAFDTIHELILGWRWLARRVRSIENADRSKSITTVNGGHVVFRTRTAGGGRALDGEKIIIDEAWAAKHAHIGSLVPLMSARSMNGNPQIIYGSSAAKAESEVLHRLVDRGRGAATDPVAARRERRYMYVEYCCPDPAKPDGTPLACDRGTKCSHELDVPGCGADKPAIIAVGNPAMGRRISLEHVLETERPNMDPAEYCRERMGWHERPAGRSEVIGLASWADLGDPVSEPAGAVALSVVYSRDRKRAWVGLAGRRRDGQWHVEIANEVTPARVVVTVGQIIARAAATPRPVCAIGIDRNGFESECIKGLTDLRSVRLPEAGPRARPVLVDIREAAPDDLEWAWGRPVILVKMAGPEVATAYSGFTTSVNEARDLHHRGQDEIRAAIEGAIPRDVGDSGQAWGRRKSGADIAPLVAVTQARWVCEQKAPLVMPEPEVYAM